LANAPKDVTIGRIKGVEKIEDLPKAILDSLLEGLTTSPQDFAIMGMGFLVGYEGMDIMAFMMKPFNDMMNNALAVFKGASEAIPKAMDTMFDLANIPTQMGGIAQDLFDLIVGGKWFPNKHITPASKGQAGPGTSYYGAPPPGVAPEDWPPYGTTLSKLQDEIDDAPEADKLKLTFEQIMAEQKLKILLGCLGAITAYTISRPGVAQTIVGTVGGVIGKGIEAVGEAVPF